MDLVLCLRYSKCLGVSLIYVAHNGGAFLGFYFSLVSLVSYMYTLVRFREMVVIRDTIPIICTLRKWIKKRKIN